MDAPLPFEQVGRLPAPGDNVAIAVRRVEAGAVIERGKDRLTLPVTVLEGHRFATEHNPRGDAIALLGIAFRVRVAGYRARRIYLQRKKFCASCINATSTSRSVAAELPDYYVPFRLDESEFRPGRQVDLYPTPGTFEGYARPGGRGVGTRNHIAILGTTSRTASYARALADRFKQAPNQYPHIDGVVAIAHTEGGGNAPPNNIDFVLRTLAGFMVHPNVGARCSRSTSALNSLTTRALRNFMVSHGYGLDHLLHRFFTLRGDFMPALDEGGKDRAVVARSSERL